MPPKKKKSKMETAKALSCDFLRIKELVSLPIAPGLIYGDTSHARRMYKEADRGRIREAIETLVGTNLKILTFEDLNKIGKCRGHPWGNLAAARVLNLSQQKECILITIYDDEELTATDAIKTCAQSANWRITTETNL